MQLQDQKAVSRNDPEHGRFLRLAFGDATAATVLAGSRSLNLSSGVAAVVFEAWRQIGVLVAAS